MPAQSVTPRTVNNGRSTSPLLGVPPNPRVGTTTFTKPGNGSGDGASVSRVRSVSSQRAVFTIVTGAARADSTNTGRSGGEADAPPQLSLRSLSPAFQPLEPGVYSKGLPTRAAISRTGSVAAATTTTATIRDHPPGYNTALKKSATAVTGVNTQRSASRETGPSLVSSRHPLGINASQRAASGDVKKQIPSKEQLHSLRPMQNTAVSSSGPHQVAAHGTGVAPRKRSADSSMPRVAAPPMNPSVQPRTYRRSLSTDAVPHMTRGPSADRHQPPTTRQHQPAVLNVVSSRGKSSDTQKPTKVQQQALRPPSQKVAEVIGHLAASAGAAQRPASESGDAFTTTVPTATPSIQRNAAAAKLDYSDNEWTPNDKPLGGELHDGGVRPIAIPDCSAARGVVVESGGEHDPNEADEQRTHYEQTTLNVPTLKLGTPAAPVVVPQPIHVVQFDAPTVNLAARQRIAHSKSIIEERELETSKAAALCKRYNCGDAISMQHRGRHFLTTTNLVGTCSRRSASGGGKPTGVAGASARSASASQYASRSISPDISIQHVYRGRSVDDPHHNQSSHRSGSCNTATTSTAATRAQEIEDRLQRFSQQRQMHRQLAVPVHHYLRPAESMQHESLRRNQLASSSVVDSSPILSEQGRSSPPSSPSKLMPIVSSKELNSKSFERSPDRAKELKTSQKTTFKRLLELGMAEDAKRASSVSNSNQHQEPKWVEDGAESMSASPPSLDRTQGTVPVVRHFEPFQRDTTTTSPLLSRGADSPRGARSGTNFEDSMSSDRTHNNNNNNGAYHADTGSFDQPRISPDTYKDFEQQKAAKAVAEKKRLEEEQASKRRQEAMHIAYTRMKSPVPIPEKAPARNLY